MGESFYRVAFIRADDHPKAEPVRFTVRAETEQGAIAEAKRRQGAPDEYDDVEVTRS